ncbi:hypothetical protein DC74_3241 [Streptomyces noursei]|nr:hypothetical protein DC74_3241 [Streptomyces noursei]
MSASTTSFSASAMTITATPMRRMNSRFPRTSSWPADASGDCPSEDCSSGDPRCSAGRRPTPRRTRAQMSLLATVAQAISAPDDVDITADSAAASTSPRTPTGSASFTIVANASSGLPRWG